MHSKGESLARSANGHVLVQSQQKLADTLTVMDESPACRMKNALGIDRLSEFEIWALCFVFLKKRNYYELQ